MVYMGILSEWLFVLLLLNSCTFCNSYTIICGVKELLINHVCPIYDLIHHSFPKREMLKAGIWQSAFIFWGAKQHNVTNNVYLNCKKIHSSVSLSLCSPICVSACMHACVCVWSQASLLWLGAHFDQSLLDEAYAPVALIKPQQNVPCWVSYCLPTTAK